MKHLFFVLSFLLASGALLVVGFAPKFAEADERPTIVIDPGHGGVDSGSRSISGVNEKKIVLSYARELKRQVEADGRYRVVLTRDKDIFLH